MTITTQGVNIIRANLDTVLAKVNQARVKYGLGSGTLGSEPSVLSSHIGTLATLTTQAKTAAPANTIDLSNIKNYSVGNYVTAAILDEIYNRATDIYNVCSCNCDRCDCQCDRCDCDCDRCACEGVCDCNCDRCPCDCERCTCEGVCDCNCDRCTCEGVCDCNCDRCDCNCNQCPQ